MKPIDRKKIQVIQTPESGIVIPDNILDFVTLPPAFSGMTIKRLRWCHVDDIKVSRGKNKTRKTDTSTEKVKEWKSAFKDFSKYLSSGILPEQMPSDTYRPYAFSPALVDYETTEAIDIRHRRKGIKGTGLNYIWIAEVEFDTIKNRLKAESLINKKTGFVQYERQEKDNGKETDDIDVAVIAMYEEGQLEKDKNNSYDKSFRKELRELGAKEHTLDKRVKRIKVAISNGESHYISCTATEIKERCDTNGIEYDDDIVHIMDDGIAKAIKNSDTPMHNFAKKKYGNDILTKIRFILLNDKPMPNLFTGYHDMISSDIKVVDEFLTNFGPNACNYYIEIGKKAEKRKKEFESMSVHRMPATPDEESKYNEKLKKL
jgi:hypothetical protein